METYTEAGYNADEMENIFDTSARIVRGFWRVADNGDVMTTTMMLMLMLLMTMDT
jgi:hypothetical protein